MGPRNAPWCFHLTHGSSGSTRVQTPDVISIGSSVLAQHTAKLEHTYHTNYIFGIIRTYFNVLIVRKSYCGKRYYTTITHLNDTELEKVNTETLKLQ